MRYHLLLFLIISSCDYNEEKEHQLSNGGITGETHTIESDLSDIVSYEKYKEGGNYY
jgi:hypothetical protein